MSNLYKIKGYDGLSYDLNDLFRFSTTANTDAKFDFLKSGTTNYIKGPNNKSSLINATNDPNDTTKAKQAEYGKTEIFGWNNNFGLDSCTFTDYNNTSSGITANYLCANYKNFQSSGATGYNTSIPRWCDYLIAVIVGGGGGGGPSWENDDNGLSGEGGSGGGFLVCKMKELDWTGSPTPNYYFKTKVGAGGSATAGTYTNKNWQEYNSGTGVDSVVTIYKNSSGNIYATARAKGGVGGTNNTEYNKNNVKATRCNDALNSSNSSYSFGKTIIGTGNEEIFSAVGKDGWGSGRTAGADGGDADFGHAQINMTRSYGGECMLGCFFDDTIIGSWDANYKSTHSLDYTNFNAGIKTTGTTHPMAYGQGGWSGHTLDDHGHAVDGHPGIQGWVRVYYMRKPLT
jgi:hypothetical protein